MSKFSELINGETPVLVDFFAEWCGPCKAMAPVLSAVSQQVQGKAKIIKVDVDKNPEAAGKYQIRSVPTLMIFKQGQVKWKHSGTVPQHELISVINQFT